MRGVTSEKRAPLGAAVTEADVDASLVEDIEFDVNSDERVTQALETRRVDVRLVPFTDMLHCVDGWYCGDAEG